MKMIPLGNTDVMVSDLCLGTMTYGTHTLDDDAHRQIDMSLDAGINFLDVAEMYPVNPVTKETAGMSEETLGRWFTKTGRREDVVLATKISGDSAMLRPGGFSKANMREAVENSLRRLETDYIDLYQLHWPNRGSYAFRQNWTFDPSKQDKEAEWANMIGVMEAAKELVAEGKIRHMGLSNESAWGTMKWLDAAEETGGPRMVSIQNEYSLLYRMFDTDMAEVSIHEDVTLLSYSPLGCGLLTGKYQNGALPEGSRMYINGDLGGRKTDRVFDATQAYLDIAAKHGLDPVQMSLAWQMTRPFPISAIFGATNVSQLEVILAGKDLVLSQDVLDDIEAAHKAWPLPY